MSKLIKALKEFGKKCNTSGTAPQGKTVCEVINNIASNFNINGAKGDTGKGVKSIALTTTEGAVTGGTVTFTDDTTAAITVTEAE